MGKICQKYHKIQDFAEGYYNRGMYYQDSGQSPKAIEEYTKATGPDLKMAVAALL